MIDPHPAVSRRITFPLSGSPKVGDLTVPNSPIVIVGANGSGKTRLGVWIEEKNDLNLSNRELICHRVSGHRALQWPKKATPTDTRKALSRLHYGSENLSGQNRLSNRWHSSPATHLLDDFDDLLTVLLSEEFKVLSEVRRSHELPQESALTKAVRIWSSVHPHRQIEVEGTRVLIRTRDGDYDAEQMSDGERGTFYLIGQSMLAPDCGILIVDEPELHLHRAIMGRLWDEIEAVRPDLLIVYLTHDLEFAASRKAGKTILLRSFDGEKTWTWDEVSDSIDGMAESDRLQILGNRRPVLFVEGTRGGLDERLFALLYPDHLVMAQGSCDNVIHLVASMKRSPQFHHVSAIGIVDRDERSTDSIATLRNAAVYCHPARAIEQLMCHPTVLKEVAKYLGLDWQNKRSEVVNRLRTAFGAGTAAHESLAVPIAWGAVERSIKSFPSPTKSAETARSALRSHLDVERQESLFASSLASTTARIARLADIADWTDDDFMDAIRLLKAKGVNGQVASVLGVHNSVADNLWLKVIDNSSECKTLLRAGIGLPENES